MMDAGERLSPSGDLTSRPLTLDDLRLVSARVALGEKDARELPQVAAWALAGGVDAPSLRELAGLSSADVRECHDLFLAAVSELGLPLPRLNDARRLLAIAWANRMLAGSLTPYEASRLIWRRAWDCDEGPDELTVFVGLASEWEDSLQDRAAIEREMLSAAQALVESGAAS